MAHMTEKAPARVPDGRDLLLFFALACLITWALDLPLALAFATHVRPPSYALSLVGLGAWGPTLAALIVAARRRVLGSVFGRWRVNPLWVVAGLLLPAALHFPATLIDVALGGHPAQWFYPPTRPENVAAMVMFPLGEEFGWRGFAYPRLARRYGAVVGSLILGTVWGVWHLGMLFTPDAGWPSLLLLGAYMVDLALQSVVMAWFFERGNRSLAVAIAIHAGAHLDNVYRSPGAGTRLQLLRLLVLLVAASFAARGLAARRGEGRNA